jgi:predicted membrane channel-forming protein YqfA (hemolysin III family)
MSAIEAPGSDPKWDQSLGEELANCISHGLGLLAALIGAPILMIAAWRGGDRFFFVGTAVFTAAMLLVYLGSTLYHAWPRGPVKSVFQVIDHSAIFLLIAGTYTPFTLGPLRGVWGWTILALVWALAIFGVILALGCSPVVMCLLPARGNDASVIIGALGLVGQIVAVMLGSIALYETDKDPHLAGRPLAITTVLTGGLASLITIYFLIGHG